ncbi:23S rRNA (uracil(1939)-C(5))-methyltransferase RlmD [Microaceticoccus formicicus]|uniref:23S rRNA (uracil(1939)-C(5))-methyltransferase RlmD n=1 Tax=Microaceticoccus formicicus TaxID=3118105 RepID=UPI003CD04881|nr:23S rRNA (uracil(1939)-C(5))-methyltransferase RlmD [Peptoniphilaceae bacterium AMB_02]
MKCKIFDICGGCDFSHESTAEQNEYKDDYIKNIFKDRFIPKEIISMENPYYYRNKSLRTYQKKGKNDVLAGIYAKKSHKIVEVEDCLIENEVSQRIFKTILQIAKRYKMEPYDEDNEIGLLRHVLIRRGHNSKEVMVILVLANTYFTGKKNFVKLLVKKHPEITTIVVNYNKRKSSVVLEGKYETIYGPGFIYDTLLGLKFKISPSSFYQVNSVQTEFLYKKVIELGDFKEGDRVLDAYCGIGTIGMIVSKYVREVIGVENNEKAVRDANINKKINSKENINFINADATEYIMENINEHFDKVIMDPPRAGSTREFLDALLKMSPEKIIYVSCNPDTLVRDLDVLVSKYRIDEVQPVDMFPFTKHVECLVLMSKVDK